MCNKAHFSEIRTGSVKRYLAYVTAVAAVLAVVLIPPFLHWNQQKEVWLSARANALDAGSLSLQETLRGLAAYYKLSNREDRPTTIHLSLNENDLKELTDWRTDALSLGFLTSKHKQQVPAIISSDGRRMNASVRLRGNQLDHLAGEKWSLKVHLKQGARFNGLRRFSLQAPYTRSFQSEAIIADAMRNVGVLAPRIDYVELAINGDNIGIMQITEEFDTPLLESQGRRFGPLLQLDDSHTWKLARTTEHYAQNSGNGERFDKRAWWNLYSGWRSAMPKAYGKYGKRKKKEDLNAALAQWMAFTDNQKRPSEIFDIDAFVDFYIVCEYFAAHNLAQWLNFRVHYNTLTARFEPIAYDADLNFKPLVNQQTRNQQSRNSPLICLNPRNTLARTLMQDRKFAAHWTNRIRELDEKITSEQFANYIVERDKLYRSKLAADYPWLPAFDFNNAKRRCQQLCGLQVDDFRLPVGGKRPLPKPKSIPLNNLPPVVNVYLAEDERGPHVSIRNRIHADVVIKSLAYANRINEQLVPLIGQNGTGQHATEQSTSLGSIQGTSQAISQLPVKLRSVHALHATTGISTGATAQARVDLPDAALTGEDRLALEIEVDGLGTQNAVLKPFPLPRHTARPRSTPIDQLVQDYSFLTLDQSGTMLTIAKGQWQIDDLVILPRNIDLIITSGTELLFTPNAGIVVNGNLTIHGEESAPVIFDATDRTTGWYGIFSHGVGKRISIKHATFNATRGFEEPGWRQPAGLLFHQANVVFEHVNITNSCADDAINLIRSNVNMQHTRISNSCSDALDIDSSSGMLYGMDLSQAGGDLLDISDSTVSLTSGVFADAGDKAISIGEASEVEISEVRLSHSTIGLAVKDLSSVSIKKARLTSLDVGLMAFQKKAEYGPATIVGNELAIDAEQQYVMEKMSSIVLNNEELPVTPFDLSDYY